MRMCLVYCVCCCVYFIFFEWSNFCATSKLLNYTACKWENYRLGKCRRLALSPFTELCKQGEGVETKSNIREAEAPADRPGEGQGRAQAAVCGEVSITSTPFPPISSSQVQELWFPPLPHFSGSTCCENCCGFKTILAVAKNPGVHLMAWENLRCHSRSHLTDTLPYEEAAAQKHWLVSADALWPQEVKEQATWMW